MKVDAEKLTKIPLRMSVRYQTYGMQIEAVMARSTEMHYDPVAHHFDHGGKPRLAVSHSHPG